MFNDVFVLMQYYLSTLALIFLFGLFGSTLMLLLKIETTNEQFFKVLISPLVGLSGLALIVLAIIRYTDGLSRYAIWTLTGIVFVARAYQLIRIGLEKINRVIIKKLLGHAMFSAFIGLAVYFPFFMQNSSSPLSLTSATWYNNDLGAYIQMATNVVRTGFKENGLIDNYQFGFQASFDHPAAQGIYAMASQVLNRHPYEVGIIAMSSVLGSLALACIAMISRLGNSNSAARFLGLACVFNPIFIMIVLEYFFGQILAVSLMFGMFAVFFIDSKSKWRVSAVTAVVALSAFLSSPEVAVTLLPILTFVGLTTISSSVKDFFRAVFRQIISLVLIFGIAYWLYGETFTKQFSIVSRTTQAGIAGWSLDITSPSVFFGLFNSQIGGPYSAIVRCFDVVIILGLIYWFKNLITKNRITISLSILLGSAALAMLLAYYIWGLSAYQSWKTLATLSVFLMFAISIVSSFKDSPKSVVGISVISIFIVGSTYDFLGYAWKDVAAKHIERDLVEIISTKEFEKQTAINLLLDPFFETMGASAMPNVPVRMASPSYQFGGVQSLKYLCTLTKRNYLDSFEHGSVILEIGQYVLVGTPKCK